ncbi:uncharacterized protein LOC134278991 [Saccostrea cucullata]|uniref:uncharacterized protein LOC134278991 n=1 Tax=Saccostrea cuccullata TaxID=36930 RepID=UPI002ED0769A
MIDQFTKWLECYAVPNQGAEQVAMSFVEGFIARIGCPLQIHSDQGRNFMSDLFQRLCKMLEITKTRTTPYRSCANGQIERYNRTVLQSIRCYLKNVRFQRQWDRHLQLIAGAIRATVNRQTGFTANKMMLGREILLPVDIMMGVGENQQPRVPSDYVEELEEVMSQVHTIARENLHGAQMRQKRTYDLQLHNHTYDVGDLVYMIDSSTKIGRSKKLQKPWIGPFVVTQKLSPVLYRIKNRRKEKVVHHDKLKKCSDRDIPVWLTRLRHTVTMAEPTQEEEKEEEDGCYLGNLYDDQRGNILNQDSRAPNNSGDNPTTTCDSNPASRANSWERRRVRLPKALADYDLS